MKTFLKRSLLAITMILASSWAMAQDMGVIVGYRSNSASVDDSVMPDASVKSQAGFQLGGVGFFPISGDKVLVRTGFIYAEKKYSIESSLATIDTKFTYFDIPATLMYKFSDYGGAFFGPVISLNVSSDCGSGSCKDVASTMMPLVVGASFKFAPQLGAEFYYETASGSPVKGLKDPKAVALNLMITFD